MVKYILSAVFIGISVLLFVLFTQNIYEQIKLNKAVLQRYSAAIDKANEVREILVQKQERYREISPEYREKLNKMVPLYVDNIQLLLDLEGIVSRYNMRMNKINISNPNEAESNKNKASSNLKLGAAVKGNDVNSIDISFELTAYYDDFIKFIRDLERSLRIVDVVGVQVASAADANNLNQVPQGQQDGVYTFKVVLRTYWVADLTNAYE